MKGKKAFTILGTLVLLADINNGVKTNVEYYTATGDVSFYSGDGKVLRINDCATKIGQYNPPAGTPIYLTNLEDGTKRTLYKWDRGALPGIVLDITYSTWITYQYPTIKGTFKGAYYHYW